MRFQDGVGETACLSQKEECNRMYTLHYDSPLGGILLAADEAGLTGLWFEGEKYFAEYPWTRNSRSAEDACLTTWQSAGWMSISAAGSRILPYRSTPLGRRSGGPCGSCCSRSLTARPRPMARWHSSWLQKQGKTPDVGTGSRRGGRPQSKSPSSSPATGWWEPAAA